MEGYRLIDNEYSPDEAAEVLNFLLDTKIKFLTRKRFGTQERGESVEQIDRRIGELQLTKEQLQQDMALTKQDYDMLKINCVVEIKKIQQGAGKKQVEQIA